MNAVLRACVLGPALGLTLGWPVPALAEVAGRVLYVFGSVSVLRGGAVLGVTVGSRVEEGDTLRTGAYSTAQLRMNDEALMALKANTDFRIQEYRYRQAPLLPAAPAKTQTAGVISMNLVRGGLRTVTGAIGLRERDDYRLTTETVTVGIRGTDYSLLQCQASCRAEDGLHVRVISGAVSLTVEGRTFLVRRGEYALVKPGAQRPEFKLDPPPELSEDGPGTEAASLPAPGAAPAEPADSKSARADETPFPEYAAADPTTSVTPEPSGARRGEVSAGRGSQRGFSWTLNEAQRTSLHAELSQPVALRLSGSELLEFSGPDDVRYDIGAAATRHQGADSASGLNWGRWSGGTATRDSAALPLDNSSLHWIYGPDSLAQPVLPRTGSATYALVGNTSPTDGSGNTGFVGSATFNTNFSTGLLSTSVSLGMGSDAIQASGSAALAPSFGGSYDSVLVNGLSAGASGGFSGFFTPAEAGAVPAGAGMVYAIDRGTGSAQVINGALAFGQPETSP